MQSHKEGYRPLSILQWILLETGHICVRYPIKCHLCGKPTRGNIITGFHDTCGC